VGVELTPAGVARWDTDGALHVQGLPAGAPMKLTVTTEERVWTTEVRAGEAITWGP
jgi:hypothetical protein